MDSNLVGIIIYSILFVALVIVIVILITNKKDSNVKKDDYIIDEPKVVESGPNLERYTEIKINDKLSKVIECLGSNYYSCTKWISATGTTTKLIWQEWDREKQRYQRVTVMFLNNKVIELTANNL